MIPALESNYGDDEAGESNAGSINNDVEQGLPTSSFWDPVTKKSKMPQGNKLHPYPNQIALELQRNWEYNACTSGQGNTPGKAPSSSSSNKDPGHRSEPKPSPVCGCGCRSGCGRGSGQGQGQGSQCKGGVEAQQGVQGRTQGPARNEVGHRDQDKAGGTGGPTPTALDELQTLAETAEQNPPNTMEVDPPLTMLVAGAKETAVAASSDKLPAASALSDKPASRQVMGKGPPRTFVPPFLAGPSACRQYTRAGLTVPCELTEACV
ncbi:hypothetical protein RHS04_08839 [Rhizoctonia solani]|uniref:Uncharacterized protein n=1 Tax=Rhizoctonia solani TaxID=456999 RepID=A0A8H7GZ52_9AGAM|nr:hypothetical protein RHS04_08839 [Rhizoctonia solani]